MEQYQLIITAHHRLGALERILRVIRHRGGYINTMEMKSSEKGMMNLWLNLSHGHSKNSLINQLAKLTDIISVN